MTSSEPDRQGILERLGLRDGLARLMRIGPLADDRTWFLPIALAGYVLTMTWTWEFPDSRGVPFPAIWVGGVIAGLIGWSYRRGELTPVATAILAVVAMVMSDISELTTQPFRDIELYLKAGERWLDGAPVYMSVPLVITPDDLSNYPFLYPPVTLPLFGALAFLPTPLAVGAWIGGSALLFVGALRGLGVSWRWSLFLLLWPPVLIGLHVGNVAIGLFGLYVAAVAWPALLAIPPVFKLYSGIAGLWLLRREHRTDLIVAVVGVLLVVVVTLPLVGIGRWQEWIVALQAYQISQQIILNLYGFGLARYLPLILVVAVAVVVTILALRARERREQLARLGVATITGSPSLFPHGWLVAIPSMVMLDTPWLWLVLGMTSVAPGPVWFVALGIVIASWFVGGMRKKYRDDPWHPLEKADVRWPGESDPERLDREDRKDHRHGRGRS